MKITFRQRKAFTLIELMIVIGIIAILAGLSLKSVLDTRKKTQVGNACESVVALANKARGYALSGIHNSDKVRLHCSGGASSSCIIQRHNVSDSPTVFVPVTGEKTLNLTQDAQINASFDMEHTIPYGGASGSVSGSINLNGAASPIKSFTITNFSASCQ